MTPSTTVPVTVTPEAAARLAELGLRAEAERMIDHARRHLPELDRIEVVLNDRHDLGGEPGVAIDVYSRRRYDPAEHGSWDLSPWMVSEYAPEVLEHLHLFYYPGEADAG